MIHEVDETLRGIVRRDVIRGGDIEVVFDAPTKEWASRRNTPTIDMYLYDIREDLRRRQYGITDVRDENGHTVGRRPIPRVFKLSYLITAWTQRPEDEHRLLSAMLGCFLRADRIALSDLTGTLAEQGWPIDITIALPPPEDRALSDVWSALGGELKPSLDLVVITPMDVDRLEDVAALVTEAPRFRFGGPEATEEVGVPREERRSASSANRAKTGVLVPGGRRVVMDRGPGPGGGGGGPGGSGGGGEGGADDASNPLAGDEYRGPLFQDEYVDPEELIQEERVKTTPDDEPGRVFNIRGDTNPPRG